MTEHSTPAPRALLDAWEELRRVSPIERALRLAALWDPHVEWANRTLGERDRALWAMRAALFGANVEAVVRCRACPSSYELVLGVDELSRPQPSSDSVEVSSGALVFRLRAPTSTDVIRALAGGGEQEILRSCTSVQEDGLDLSFEAVPRELHALLEEQIAGIDPQIGFALGIECADCAVRSIFRLDAGDFLYAELERWCRSLLREIHLLAQAYGWTEDHILALSSFRRRSYLELVEERA
jgi:hypothetical protein